jgi:PhoH-like ATPase
MRRTTVVAGLLVVTLGASAYAHDSKGEISPHEPSAVASRFEQACEGLLTGPALKSAQEKWTGKTVIFDTNVLLNDPYAIYKYPGAKVVIPGTVIEEIDAKKSDQQTGKQARTFSRLIDEMLRTGGNLRQGIEIQPGTHLFVDNRNVTDLLGDTTFDRGKKDNEIIALALWYTLNVPGHDNVVLVSDDNNVRIKAASEEVLSIPFEYEWVTSAKEIKHSYRELKIDEADMRKFLATGELKKPDDFAIAPNEFVMLQTEGLPEGSPDLIARYVYDRSEPSKSSLRKLPDFSQLAFPPLNLEQAMALDLLLDPNVQLVIMEADAGTGKTFITLSAALMQNPNGKFHRYEEVMITKPMVHMGKTEMGALPGGKDEKLLEFFNSYYDNLRVLNSKSSVQAQGKGSTAQAANKKQMASNGKKVNVPNLELLAFPYVRGRSLHYVFLIVDEFQNTNILEAKTVLTRAAEGTKVVVMGNVAQIDDRFLNERNNGLSVTASLFTQDSLSEEERSLVGFVQLKEGVRTDLAKLAIKVFGQPLPTR